MSKLWIPGVMVLVFSANAFAHRGWDDDDDWYGYRRDYVVARPVYAYAPPPVVYRERVVVERRPVYYESAPRYYAPRRAHRGNSYNRLAGQAVGAIAGGILGNQVGQGNGRVAATAVGAVVGSIVGGNLSRY